MPAGRVLCGALLGAGLSFITSLGLSAATDLLSAGLAICPPPLDVVFFGNSLDALVSIAPAFSEVLG